MLTEEKLSQAGQKEQKSIGIKSFYSNTSYVLKKNCIRKRSTKVFIRKTGHCKMSSPNIQACQTLKMR